MTDAETSSILTQVYRYGFAGFQDLNPVVRFMHLSYAKALLDYAAETEGRDRLRRLFGIAAAGHDFDKFYAKVTEDQNQTSVRLVSAVNRAGA